MTYIETGAAAPEDLACRAVRSRLVLRDQDRAPEGDFIAVLGGTETYGKFVDRPFADLAERALDLPVLNFGCPNAGPDAFLNDPGLLHQAGRARQVVVQIMGAANLTNRFYAVHPRRNDRFLRASAFLRALFPEVDFTEYAFTGHMLSDLADRSPERFALVLGEMRTAWVNRMRLLLSRIPAPTLLLWIGSEPPGCTTDRATHPPLPGCPAYVDRAMIEALGPMAKDLQIVIPSERARAAGTAGMDLSAPEAAAGLPNPAMHAEIAAALVARLAPLRVRQ